MPRDFLESALRGAWVETNARRQLVSIGAGGKIKTLFIGNLPGAIRECPERSVISPGKCAMSMQIWHRKANVCFTSRG